MGGTTIHFEKEGRTIHLPPTLINPSRSKKKCSPFFGRNGRHNDPHGTPLPIDSKLDERKKGPDILSWKKIWEHFFVHLCLRQESQDQTGEGAEGKTHMRPLTLLNPRPTPPTQNQFQNSNGTMFAMLFQHNILINSSYVSLTRKMVKLQNIFAQ